MASGAGEFEIRIVPLASEGKEYGISIAGKLIATDFAVVIVGHSFFCQGMQSYEFGLRRHPEFTAKGRIGSIILLLENSVIAAGVRASKRNV